MLVNGRACCTSGRRTRHAETLKRMSAFGALNGRHTAAIASSSSSCTRRAARIARVAASKINKRQFSNLVFHSDSYKWEGGEEVGKTGVSLFSRRKTCGWQQGITAKEVHQARLLYALSTARQLHIRLPIAVAHHAPLEGGQFGGLRGTTHRIDTLEVMILATLVQSYLVQEIEKRHGGSHEEQLLLHKSRQRALVQLDDTLRRLCALYQIHMYRRINATPACSTAHFTLARKGWLSIFFLNFFFSTFFYKFCTIQSFEIKNKVYFD